ncbi:MAG: SPFH domain-containing protein [Acidithiobacillus ferriphilus]|jgi:regulator of protease activity HflC (stomatin/prohibitin superfamily)|uniref:Stomatin 2 n=3 Tax=Acidithiobacillus TaxID=119977 RepID=A0A179BBM8_ACIFR|nr:MULTISPECIES: SPFH domain-containing protein [Acidithiobacillus]OYV82290.1 MAG: paraslipin [Acidithiobacillus ferrivorans]MBU2784620.1 SPFH/Band 7/PHB domain protein [Acidithiobacillus ferriphilus]MBU2828283.1 SPFH/Band 7/PHB domain protein [Acidithiobacillus ferriphilus]MBU2833695.1 SPFH/Band 7/PHB domain protein [Acidithiobacillus ferriphilus]MBU2845011.1 SPFH/Band 7/PHB domain protein [Acidithiobacillus ferriphilus]
MSSLIVILIVVVAAFFILRTTIRVVPQQRAWVVERLGKYHAVLQPGLNFIIPFLDRIAFRFDMREVPMEVPAQVCISFDNTTMTVDGVLYLQITDSVKAAYGSSNPFTAVIQLAQTTMRSEIGKLHLDAALSSRQLLNTAVASSVDEAAINWGVKVLRYEIKDITPPQEIIRAMELQITAEREKRALIAKSEGQRQQQINTSEGQRQQDINVADGRKQAEVLRAQGEAAAIQLVAEATAAAIRVIGDAARAPGGIEALQMQLAKDYIEKWGNLAKASTSLVIPADLGNIGALVGTALSMVKQQGGAAKA